jgi:uncharacterized membrane protein YhhN
MIMGSVFLALYCAAGAVNLGSIILQRKTAREGAGRIAQGTSKALLLPLLGLYYFSSASVFLPPVIFAAFFGCLGDIILFKVRKEKNLLPGLLSFLAGHILYIISLSAFAVFDVPLLVISTIIMLILETAVLRIIRPEKDMLVPVIFYTLVIGAMTVSAFLVMVQHRDFPGILAFGGSVFFIISDTILARFAFRGSLTKYVDCWVMSTYIMAQGCLITGLGNLR